MARLCNRRRRRGRPRTSDLSGSLAPLGAPSAPRESRGPLSSRNLTARRPRPREVLLPRARPRERAGPRGPGTAASFPRRADRPRSPGVRTPYDR